MFDPLQVVRSKNAVIVENVNMRTRVFKPNPEIRGRKFKREGLVHVSNVMLVDPKEKKPTRVKYTFTSAGNKLRVSKKSCTLMIGFDYMPLIHILFIYSFTFQCFSHGHSS